MASTNKPTVKTKAAKAAAKATALRPRKAVGALSGFMEFVRKQGVVGLAVGLAIGTQASELVKSIVSSVITPSVDLLVGREGLGGLTWTARIGDRVSTFNFGLMIDSMIKFLAVAAVIYFVIIGLKLDKLDKKKD